jgi:hypothetical protein
LTHIFQAIGSKKLTNTMVQLTRKIQGAPSRRKTAAQAAQIEIKQCKLEGYQQHPILKLCNPQITQKILLYATENVKTQGTTVGHPDNDITEGVSPKSCVRPTWGNNSKERTTNTTKKISQYLEIRTNRSQNSPTGTKSRLTHLVNKTLHVVITGRIRLRGNCETPTSQIKSDDAYSWPTIHKQRRSSNKTTTIKEMAEEGTPLKKPRHEDITQENEQVEGTEANSNMLILPININLPQEAFSPSQGKKRPVSELNNNDQIQRNLLMHQEQDKQTPVELEPGFPSDDECMPNSTPSELPLPAVCPQVPSQRSIRWLKSAQQFAGSFGLTTADLSKAVFLLPGMQQVFDQYTSARESVPAGCQTIFPFALGADTFDEAFSQAAVIQDQSARLERVQQVINDVAIALSHEDAANTMLDSYMGRLKHLKASILRLGEHQDAFAKAVATQGALAVATVEFHRPQLRQAVKEKFKTRVSRLDASIADDIAHTTHWIKTFSNSLPEDIQDVERHWGTHMSLRHTLDLAHRAFVQKTLDLTMSPTKSAYTMRRVSLCEELWKMPTPESMTERVLQRRQRLLTLMSCPHRTSDYQPRGEPWLRTLVTAGGRPHNSTLVMT